MRPGEVRLHLQVAREPFFNADLQRVVTGGPTGSYLDDRPEVCVLWPAVIHRGTKYAGVQFDRCREVVSFVADISNVKGDRVRKLLLDGDVPALHDGQAKVLRKHGAHGHRCGESGVGSGAEAR